MQSLHSHHHHPSSNHHLHTSFTPLSLSLPLPPSPPLSLTVAPWAGAWLLGDDFLQAVDDTVLVAEPLAVGGSEGLHLTSVLSAVSLQLDSVLVRLLLQLLQMGVLLQKTQQVGHHRHQGRLCQLGKTNVGLNIFIFTKGRISELYVL